VGSGRDPREAVARRGGLNGKGDYQPLHSFLVGYVEIGRAAAVLYEGKFSVPCGPFRFFSFSSLGKRGLFTVGVA